MESRWVSFRSALKSHVVQALLASALLVPVVATFGQYWSSGWWTTSMPVALLFWPGQGWQWAVSAPVWLSMGAMLTSYVVGIGWLTRRRTLSVVVLCAIGGLIAASLAGTALNTLPGWKELQQVASMNLAGRANRAIFSLWHNPVWEELVFRGIPLVALLIVRRKIPRAARIGLWCFYLVPSLIMAVYHVPGHGPSRLVDTFILSVVFAWMTLRYSFFAPLVIHCLFDAMMTINFAKLPNIPKSEVAWLAAHSTTLNSTWTMTLLLWIGAIPIVLVIRRRAQFMVSR